MPHLAFRAFDQGLTGKKGKNTRYNRGILRNPFESRVNISGHPSIFSIATSMAQIRTTPIIRRFLDLEGGFCTQRFIRINHIRFM